MPPAWFAYEYSAESEPESEHIRDIIAELRPNLEILLARCEERQQKNAQAIIDANELIQLI